MKIISEAIVSSSEMIKSYKLCREKAETFGKIFILRNSQPETVLFSIAEYKRLCNHLKTLEGPESEKFL